MFLIGKKKKQNLAVFGGFVVFASLFFLIGAHPAFAAGLGDSATNGGGIIGGIVQVGSAPFLWVANVVLYAFFVVLGLLLSLAGIALDWAINPNNFYLVVSNNAAIYVTWKFVRDLLNLAFIAALLFIAFGTVFQTDKFNYKLILNLVIMALLVNFSFPIARFIIDVANVLFYGIFNLAGLGNRSFSSNIADSINLAALVAPDTSFWEGFASPGVLTAKLVFSNVFLFLTSATFLAIAALFIIRIAVLAVLIIVSPVGFVASAFPGMNKYANQWWDQIIKQSFGAPVMAMMLVIAIQIMKPIKDSLAANISAAASGQVVGNYSPIIISATTLAIPLIIMWVGIMAALQMGAAGSDIASKYLKQASNWTKKKFTGSYKYAVRHNPVSNFAVGAASGAKERVADTKIAKLFTGPSRIQAGSKGLVMGGAAGARKELKKLHDKEVYEQVKKNKENNVSNSELRAGLNGSDKVAAAAAAITLSERKAITTAEDFSKALKALGDNAKEVGDLIKNSEGDALKFDTSNPAKAAEFKALLDRPVFDPRENPKLREQLEGKIKKEGHVKSLIDYDINSDPAIASTPAGSPQRLDVYRKYLDKLNPEQLAEVKGIHGDATHATDAELAALVREKRATSVWSTQDLQDAYKKLNNEQRAQWRASGIAP